MHLNNFTIPRQIYVFFIGLFVLIACQLASTDKSNSILNIQIDKDNDSLQSFDSLIIKVYNYDSSFTQEIFHGKLTNPNQVKGILLDPRVGEEFKIGYVGFRNNKIGLNKLITIKGRYQTESRDLGIEIELSHDDSLYAKLLLPEILIPNDTTIVEGDSLLIIVSVKNPYRGQGFLSLKEPFQGAKLDTSGLGGITAKFSLKSDFNQGRNEPYALKFAYSSGTNQIEKIMLLKIVNVNRSPKFLGIADQKVNENQLLTFKVEATDLDQDILSLTVDSLPKGSTLTGGLFSWKPVVGQAGNYSLKMKISDGKAFDLIAVLITVGNVDVPPPLTLERISPSKETVTNISPLVAIFKVNNVLIEKKFNLVPGNNKLFMDTTVTSRTAIDTFSVVYDTLPPSRPVVNGLTPINKLVPTWTWKGGSDGFGVYRYRLDNMDLSSAKETRDSSFTPATELIGAFHTLYVQARDLAGNWSPLGSWVIQIDTVRPAPPLLTLNQSSPTNNTQPTWKWIAGVDDVLGRFRFKIDDPGLSIGAIETQATSFTPSKDQPLSAGQHTFYLQQQDSAGNWSATTTQSIWIDLTPPKPPKIFSPSIHTTSLRPSWNWTSGGNGGAGNFRFVIDDSIALSKGIPNSQKNFTSPNDLSVGSKHTIFVQESDSAGNWSEPGSYRVRIHGQTGFAVANIGGLVSTVNDGATWDTVATGTTNDLFSIFFANSNLGYTVGQNGTVLKTSNSGSNWSAIEVGTNQDLYSINFTDDRNGVAVGNNGAFIRTSGENSPWVSTISPPFRFLSSASFVNSKLGYALGAIGSSMNSIVFKTSDGGASWDSVASTPNSLYSICFTDINTGYAVGAAGRIIKTVDGGKTWIVLSSGTNDYLNTVFFVSDDIGFAAGHAGLILKTQNAGASWSIQNTGIIEDINSIFFTDIKIGFGVGRNATIFKTIDGGLSWTITSKILPTVITSCGVGCSKENSREFFSIYFP